MRWLDWLLTKGWPARRVPRPPRRPTRKASRATPPASQRRSLGLALGGGGIRGAAHLGVLEVLLEHALMPDFVAGTSAGSIAGALFAGGLSPGEMARRLSRIERESVFDLTLSRLQMLPVAIGMLMEIAGLGNGRHRLPSGLIRGEAFEAWMRGQLRGLGFESLRLPLYVVASDLRSGRTVVFGPASQPPRSLPNDLVYLTGVDVATAVRASSSIPVLFQPRLLDGYVLVDGIVTEPVPAEILRLVGADVVVAVDLGGSELGEAALDSLLDIFHRAVGVAGTRYANMRLERFADLVIRPRLTGAPLTAVHKIPEFMAAGRAAAMAALPEIQRLLKVDAARSEPSAPPSAVLKPTSGLRPPPDGEARGVSPPGQAPTS